MRGDPRQIVAFGGGGFSMERGNTLLDDYVLRLARERSSGERPKVCFLPTASGDADHYIVRFYRAFSPELCEPSHVSLFRRECAVEDVREHLPTGARFDGPAIVEQLDCTTVIEPGNKVEVDPIGNLIVSV